MPTNDAQPDADPPPIIPLMMTVADLAAELQVCEKTIRRFDIEGRIPEPNRVGRLLRWPRQMIIDWIAAGSPKRGQWHWRPRRTGA